MKTNLVIEKFLKKKSHLLDAKIRKVGEIVLSVDDEYHLKSYTSKCYSDTRNFSLLIKYQGKPGGNHA